MHLDKITVWLHIGAWVALISAAGALLLHRLGWL